MTDAISPSTEVERWLPVVGYEGFYEVSNHGRIRRVAGGPGATPNRILRPALSAQGYRVIGLSVDGQVKPKLVHRLVMFAFVGPPPPGHECNHKNGNKADPRLVNLEWVTSSQNILHAYDTGLRAPQRGEQAPQVKLTEAQVREIRSLRGVLSAPSVARQFGIKTRTVYGIWYGENWGWLQ